MCDIGGEAHGLEDVQRVTIQIGDKRVVVDLCPKDREPIEKVLAKLPKQQPTRRRGGRGRDVVYSSPDEVP